MIIKLITIFLLIFNHGKADEFENERTCKNIKVGDGIMVPNIFNSPGQIGFKASMEINKVSQILTNKSVYIEEFYDWEAKAGSRSTNDPEMPHDTLYYFQKSKEAFLISKYNCTSQSVNQHEDDHSGNPCIIDVERYIPEDLVHGNLQVYEDYGLTGMFNHFLNSKGITVFPLGNSTIEGAQVTKVFRMCFQNENVIITIYIDDQLNTPLRAVIHNKEEDQWIKTMVNYISFTAVTKSNTLSRVPDGYGCRRVTKDPLPRMDTFNGLDYQYFLELIDTNFDNINGPVTNVYSTSLYVDAHGNDNLVAFTPSDRPLHDHPLRIVVDANLNFTYKIDLITGRCAMEPLKMNRSSVIYWPYLKDMELNVLNPEVWEVGKGGDYLGEDTERGIPVSIYERNDAKFLADTSKSVIVTYYYISGSTSQPINTPPNLPMKMLIKIYDNQRTKLIRLASLNLHDYAANIPNKQQVFDISRCYSGPDDYKWFEVNYIPNDEMRNGLKEEFRVIEKAFRDLMNKDYQPTRLPRVLVDFNSGSFRVTAKILRRPSPHYSFDKISGYVLNQDDSNYQFMAQDGSLCARMCFQNPLCTRFSYCSNFQCNHEMTWSANQTKVRTSQAVNCDLYTRPLSAMPDPNDKNGQILTDILLALNEKVKNSELNLIVPLYDELAEKTINASIPAVGDVKIIDDPGNLDSARVPDDGAASLFTSPFNDYIRGRGNSKFVDESRKKRWLSLTLTQCKTTCDNDAQCNSFSYCPREGKECVLSGLHKGDLNTNNTVVSTKCTILSKRYTTSFTVRRNVYLSASCGKRLKNVKDPEACAKACLKEKKADPDSERCLSFDFCSSGSNIYCTIHHYHVLARNGPDDKHKLVNNGTCDHYTLKYSKSYKMNYNMALKTTKENTIDLVISPENCAYQCNEMGQSGSEYKCKGFEYCMMGTLQYVCRLTSDKIEGNIVSSSNCTVYERQSPARASVKSDGRKKDYSRAAEAVLAIFGLILGVVLGIFGIWVVYYKILNR